MEPGLLQQFMPQFVLDKNEAVCPVDLNRWAASSPVRDDAYDGELKGAIGQNLGNASCYLDGPAPKVCIVSNGETVASVEKSAADRIPVTGKVDVMMMEGRWFYSLLYMYAFPPTDKDQQVVHHVKIVVDTQSKAVAYGVYSLAGSLLSPAVASAGRMSFTDQSRQQAMVYLAKDTHYPLPRPGKYWKMGPQGETHACECGTKWDPLQTDLLSNELMQFKGRLSKARSAASPTEQAWWSDTPLVNIDKAFDRYLPASSRSESE